MLVKLGYKAGEGLGKSASSSSSTAGAALGSSGSNSSKAAQTEPIRPVLKDDRGGIGLEAEKKRKLREEMEAEAKKVKTEQGDYRERMRLEREERRLEAQLVAAQKIAENFDSEMHDSDEAAAAANTKDASPNTKKMASSSSSSPKKPLKSISVLWRGLVRLHLHNERERRMRHDLQQSLSSSLSSSAYKAPHEDEDEDVDESANVVDIKTLSQAERRQLVAQEAEVEEDEEDPELDEFNALPPQERLQRVVLFLREKFSYCFWCKYQYPNENMQDCPGITEEDHD